MELSVAPGHPDPFLPRPFAFINEAYRLPKAEARRIFDAEIWPAIGPQPTAFPSPVTTPTLVAIGGAPGAGKSRTAYKFRKALGVDRTVYPDMDEMLPFHPDYPDLARADDRTGYQKVSPTLCDWRGMAWERAIAEDLNVVAAPTLHDADANITAFNEFRERHGQQRPSIIDVYFMGTDDLRSQLRILSRYQDARRLNGFGRWVEPEAHEMTYKSVVDAAVRTEHEANIDSIRVLNRSGEAVYHNWRDAAGNWVMQPRIGEALAAQRRAPWTPEEQRLFHRDVARTAQELADDLRPILDGIVQRAAPFMTDVQL